MTRRDWDALLFLTGAAIGAALHWGLTLLFGTAR